MAFATSYENIGPELIPEGDYEIVIESAMETATDRGYPFLSIRCRVRGDVPQQCGGKLIFWDLWPKKTPTTEDQAVQGYSYKQIMSLSKAVGLASGTQFNTLDDWCDALVSRAVRVSVQHDTYNGRTNARVRWANPTNYPDIAYPPAEEDKKPPHQSAAMPQTASPRGEANRAAKAPAPQGFQPLEDDDDDIPF